MVPETIHYRGAETSQQNMFYTIWVDLSAEKSLSFEICELNYWC